MADLDQEQADKRQKSLIKTIADLRRATNLKARLTRLRAIPESQWQEAEVKDNAGNK